MELAARLTSGWGDDPRDPAAALSLNRIACKGDVIDPIALRKALPNNHTIMGLDRLFRRTVKGFGSIKSFVGALSTISDNVQSCPALICEIDVFAYSFLKGAKNFDLLLPPVLEYTAHSVNFQNTLNDWHSTMTSLENFERVGQSLPPDGPVSARDYLLLRKVIARPSARDELRVLATLLISGPSSPQQIVSDLGLSVPLSKRILASLHRTGIFEHENAIPTEDGSMVYAISSASIPLVVFCVRETLGLDLLSEVREENKL